MTDLEVLVEVFYVAFYPHENVKTLSYLYLFESEVSIHVVTDY